MQAHLGIQGVVPITMRTILTLNLGYNNLFARLPLPPPPHVDKHLMDLDIPKDFIFPNAEINSDQESNSSYIPLPSSSLI